MRYAFILPDWKKEEGKGLLSYFEREDPEIEKAEIKKLNQQGYNVYYYPNYSSQNIKGRALKGPDIDMFEWIFVDADIEKEKNTDKAVYQSNAQFVKTVAKFPLKPTKIVLSGHGVHAYWKINDLDRDSYLHLQKKLIRYFRTDQSIYTVKQLMRLEGFDNTKEKDNPKKCRLVKNEKGFYDLKKSYNVSDFDEYLPELTEEDEKSIQSHIASLSGETSKSKPKTTGELPQRFVKMLDSNAELSELFYNPQDRSVADMKIARALQVNNFSEAEAHAVLSHTDKGQERGNAYIIPTLREVYDNPVSLGDPEYEEVQTLISKQQLVKKEEEEIKEYKRKKALQEVREAKEEEKLQGVFSLKNTSHIWLNHYKKSIKQLDKSMKNRLPCITDDVTEVMPLEGVEMLLFGALTGQGKSTVAANVAVPILAKNKRILYLSTEERAEDILIRVAALQNGWNPNNQREWSEEIKVKRNAEVERLVQENNILIVDNYSPGVDEKTGQPIKPADLTVLEDFKLVLNSVIRDGLKFDLLIIDYISKVGLSRRTNQNVEWKIMSEATKFVEEWCKSAQTPAIVFTQLKNKTVDNEEFKVRIPGSKRILDYVTCAVEIATDYDAHTTKLICHKNRKYGKLFRKTLKFDKGRFVDQPDFDDTE